jgi:hypothetical protein
MPVCFLTFKLFIGLLACSSTVFAFETISFSDIHQCGPFNISFAGGKPPAALPLTLTVIPFRSSPISITIQNPSWNPTTSTGAVTTYLPLAAGTDFIASLDDAQGRGVGFVSDIMQIQPSDNNTCLSTSPVSQQYSIKSSLIQCRPFDVVYNTTASPSPSSVRAFRPLGPSYFLNRTQSDGTEILPPFNITSYQMTAPRGSQIVMLFSDGSGYRESSSLTPVLGDTTSNTSCLSFFTNYDAGATSSGSRLSGYD